MNKFRPQDIGTRHLIRERRLTGRVENYNWQNSVKWYPAGWKPNHISISRRFGRLHYLACHAPQPIQKKWRRAYQTFMIKHFGHYDHASMRYLNKYSCHAWM